MKQSWERGKEAKNWEMFYGSSTPQFIFITINWEQQQFVFAYVKAQKLSRMEMLNRMRGGQARASSFEKSICWKK